MRLGKSARNKNGGGFFSFLTHNPVRANVSEAIGAIEGDWDEIEGILRKYLNDPDIIVRESAIVALDAADYFGLCTPSQGPEDEEEEAESAVATAKDVNFASIKNEKPKEFVTKCHFNIIK